MAKSMKPGGGGRFQKLKAELARKGVDNPAAVAASAGRKKYGKKKFAKMGAKGRSRAARSRREQSARNAAASRVSK